MEKLKFAGITLGAAIVFALVMYLVIYGAITVIQEQDRLETEFTTYEGRITAVVHTEQESLVYLNSEPQVLKIQGNVQFVIGQEYRITVDGMGKLINAVITGD